MRFEDFFAEDENALAEAKEEMLEDDALKKVFPEPVAVPEAMARFRRCLRPGPSSGQQGFHSHALVGT